MFSFYPPKWGAEQIVQDCAGSAASVVVLDSRGVGEADQLVDNRRRRFAAIEMLANGADRHLGQQELRAAQLVPPGASEDQTGEAREAGLHPLGLRRDPVAQRRRPPAL